jgi:hypothetical protein
MKRAAIGFARHQLARALATNLSKKLSENHEQARVSFAPARSAGAFFSAEDIRGALGRAPDATTEPHCPVGYIVIAT